MGIFKELLSFSKGLIMDPESRLREIFNGGTRAAVPIAVYVVCILVNALFMKIKPPDFPAEFAQLGLPEKSYIFYFSVELWWGTLFAAASSALFLYFLRTFSAGKIFLKTLLCAGSIVALAGTAFYARHTLVFRLLSAVMLLFAAGVIRTEQKIWWRFFQATLALSLISAVVLPFEFAAVYLRSENLFIVAELATGLWTLLLFIKMAKIFTGASIPNAVISLGVAFLSDVLFISLLYLSGVIPLNFYELMLSL